MSLRAALLGVVRRVTPDAIRRRFALKFFIALLCIGVLVGGVGVVGTGQIEAAFQDQVHEEHADIAKQEAESLAGWNERHVQFVETMTRAESVQRGNESQIQSYFDQQMRGRSMSSDSSPNLHYVDSVDGTIGASTKSSFAGESIAELNTTVRQAMDASETTVTPAYRSRATYGDPITRVAYVSPVRGREALVVYTVPVGRYSGKLGTDNERATFVIDGDHRVVFRESGSDFLEDYGEDDGPVGAARELGPSTSGATRTGPASGVVADRASIGENEYVVGYAQVIHTDWVVLVHTDVETAYGTVRSLVEQGLIATLIGVTAIGVIGAILGRNTARDVDRLTRATEAMQDGDLNVTVESGRIDTVGRLYDGFASMRDSLKSQIEEAERARKEAEVARAEAMETNDYLEGKAEAYSTAMDRAAAGDLTRRMETDGENDAMDSIATDFNEMVGELEKTVGQLKTFADRVEESGDVVDTSAESVREAAQQVAESIQTISDDAHEQRDEVEQAAAAVDAAIDALDAGDVTTARESLDQVVTRLDSVADGTDQTMAEAETVAGAAEEQAAELSEVSQQADELVRYVRPLADVIGRFDTDAEHEFVFAQGPSDTRADDD